MKSEIFASFQIVGSDLEPDAITRIVGINPTKTRKVGDLIYENTMARVRFGRWIVESKLNKSIELEEHLHSVLQQLQPGWSSLIEVSTQYDASFSCTIWSYGGDRPAIYFEKEIVKKIAELNADIDVDLYIVDEP